VIQGKKLGRTLGFPTVNLAPEQTNQLLPSPGVYAGRVRLLLRDSHVRQVWPAAVSVGTNPTTDKGEASTKVEAHIMDGFHSDLYGQAIDIEFVQKLRDEKKFDSLDLLVQQISADVEESNLILQPLRLS
jgi:riboflavin kinase/FMN adenylyltransferase